MAVHIDISILLSYLRSTSNLALSCCGFYRKVTSNGFSIRTSKGGLRLKNFSFYESLDCPYLNEWMREEVFEAVRCDKIGYLNRLLDHKADIDARDDHDKSTPLIAASACGRVDCLKLLIERKAELEIKSSNGHTALMWASWFGQFNCLKLLLENKAEVEAECYGSTALSCAAWNGKIECIRLLLDHGAIVDPKIKRRFSQYTKLWEN